MNTAIKKYNGKSLGILNIIGLVALACFASCTKDYLTKNTNPNKATEEQLKYDNLALGSIITQMEAEIFPSKTLKDNVDVNNYQKMYSLAGDVYSGHQGASNAFSNNGENNTTYSMIPDWCATAFSVAYQNSMVPWYTVKIKASLSPSTFAVAQILRVAMMHRITDMYGPIPYDKFEPAVSDLPYTAQQDIYQSFFNDLDEAANTLSEYVKNNPGAKPLAAYDRIYYGDFTKWIKYAASLKLRLAMRIVYADESKAKKYAQEAINSGVFTSNDDNAMLAVDGSATVNPLYMINSSYNDTRMGANMESFLKGYNDPRMSLLFKPATFAGKDPEYRGIRNGSIFQGQTYSPFSALTVNAGTPIQIMTVAEVCFLRAEAALRWESSSVAQGNYETGIRMAFNQKIGGANASAGDATIYINNSTSKPAPYVDPLNAVNNVLAGNVNLSTITVKWDASANFETNFERIITQKWIALFPDGQEAWTEFRRTRYPKVFPVANNKSGGTINTATQIRRLPFPETEYRSNPSGIAIGLRKLGGADNGGTKLWWDKKP